MRNEEDMPCRPLHNTTEETLAKLNEDYSRRAAEATATSGRGVMGVGWPPQHTRRGTTGNPEAASS